MPRPPLRRKTPAIISASRLTDIPRFYAKWFTNRLAAGFCESANSYGGRYWISLNPRDVLGFLFWTRDPRPLGETITQLVHRRVPVAMQFTVTAYGVDIETNRVPLPEQIAAFKTITRMLEAPTCIEWRYDPILVTPTYTIDWHVASFTEIAQQLVGSTLVCNTSICEPYLHTIRRVGQEAAEYRALDPVRHKTAASKYPDTRALDSAASLLETLGQVGRKHGIELRICANPEYDGLPASQCCSMGIFQGCQGAQGIRNLPAGPSRSGCRCLATVDVGMGDSCLGGCKYCYVVHAASKPQPFYQRHDPEGVSIR